MPASPGREEKLEALLYGPMRAGLLKITPPSQWTYVTAAVMPALRPYASLLVDALEALWQEGHTSSTNGCKKCAVALRIQALVTPEPRKEG